MTFLSLCNSTETSPTHVKIMVPTRGSCENYWPDLCELILWRGENLLPLFRKLLILFQYINIPSLKGSKVCWTMVIDFLLCSFLKKWYDSLKSSSFFFISNVRFFNTNNFFPVLCGSGYLHFLSHQRKSMSLCILPPELNSRG